MEGRTGYDCNIATELRLGLPGTEDAAARTPARGTKRSKGGDGQETAAHVAKAQVVGWPPVRSQRKNGFRPKAGAEGGDDGILYVKVSMDGAPFLRKVDLKAYKGYKELRDGLGDLFKCFSLKVEGCDDSDYAITYEDKDGDWMLVGDVPWGMFITSCRRLRIMKGSEAKGLGSS